MERTGMVTFTPARWLGLLQDSELEVFSYIGRGMYGKRCIAVSIARGSLVSLGVHLASTAAAALTNDVDAAASEDDPLELAYETVAAVAAVMETARVDTRGMADIIIYWPTMTWPEEAGG